MMQDYGTGEKSVDPAKSVPSEGAGTDFRSKAVQFSQDVMSAAGKAATLVGDLNGDGKVDEQDARIARDRMAAAISAGTDEAGKLAKTVADSSLAKDVAAFGAVGAAIAIPVPVIGPVVGAVVGAGLGVWRNLSRKETASAPVSAAPEAKVDVVSELDRFFALKEKGIINQEEFDAMKLRLLK